MKDPRTRSAEEWGSGNDSARASNTVARSPSFLLAQPTISGEESTPVKLAGERGANHANHLPVPQPTSTTSRPRTCGRTSDKNRCSNESRGFACWSYTEDHL